MSKPKANRPERDPISSKRTFLFLLTFALIFIGVALFVIRPATSSSPQVVANAALAEGKALFDTYCAACHGPQGQGGVVANALPLNDTGAAWQLSDEELIHILRNGRNQMPAMAADLSDQEVAAIIAYLKSWWTPEQRAEQIGNIGEDLP